MKKKSKFLFAATLVLVFLCWITIAFAQEIMQLEVDEAIICEDVSNLEPIGVDVEFPVYMGKLYCFTRIKGAKEPTTITHVWYFETNERARVDLAVKTSDWRTFSSKKIQPGEIGAWRVAVLNSEGTILKEVQFITTSEEEDSLGDTEVKEPM